MDLYQHIYSFNCASGAGNFFLFVDRIPNGLLHCYSSSIDKSILAVHGDCSLLGESVDPNSVHEVSYSRQWAVESMAFAVGSYQRAHSSY